MSNVKVHFMHNYTHNKFMPFNILYIRFRRRIFLLVFNTGTRIKRKEFHHHHDGRNDYEEDDDRAARKVGVEKGVGAMCSEGVRVTKGALPAPRSDDR